MPGCLATRAGRSQRARLSMSPPASTTFARGKPHERDRGLLLLRNLTRAAIVGATALAGVFAGVVAEAAKSRAGRSARVVTVTRPVHRANPKRVPPPPSAPPVGAAAAATPAPAPAPTPAPVPAPTQAPPVVVSGGS
jgi:hypothetical protein